MSLTPLDRPDCYEYINHHPHFRQEFLQNNNFHKIISITKSLPEKIDMLLYDLRAMTLDEYIETEINGDTEDNITIYESDTTHIPDYQKEFIDDLSISENKENKDCFTILKILTILEYGETFPNIKRHYSRFKFNIKSIHRLLNYGLVDLRHRVITLNREYRPAGSIVITVSPLISSYIKKITNADDNIELIKEGLELSLGTHWISGDVKFNSSAKEQILESHSYGPGNVHSLISQFMRYTIKEQLLREFKSIFYASLCYIDLLYDKGRFNDVILASSDILSICKDFDDVIKTYKLQIRKADGLRMLSMYEEAEIEFKEVLNKTPNMTKKELIEIHIELAHIKENENNREETAKHVREVKKMTHNKSSYWVRAESIMANFLPKPERIKKLSRLEKKARNLKFAQAHHNILLSIANIISDKEKKRDIYNSVIKSSTDEYTKIRAIIRNAKNIIENGELGQITNIDRERLKDTYIYLFTQRLETLTDTCHDILWEVYSSEGDFQSLLNLYRHSTIVWWLNGRNEKDYKYLHNLYEKKDLFENTDVNTLYLEIIIPRMEHYSQSNISAQLG